MRLYFKKSISSQLKGIFGKYSFDVGVLDSSVHKEAKRGVRGLKGQDVISEYAGGPIRKTSSKSSGKTNKQILIDNMDRLNRNILGEPFQKKTSEIIEFTGSFFKLAFGASEQKRCENLLQAIVRNPILRKEYGPNSAITKKIKTFDRALIDTGQMFKAIKAKVKVRV